MALRHFWRSLHARSTRPTVGRSGSRRPKTRKPYLEALEDRSIPTVGFGSALGVGNDTGSSSARDVVVDAAGNSYVTGAFSGTTDFDPANIHPGDVDILTARGSHDAYVAKYAADNSLVWVKRMGGDTVFEFGSDIGWDIAIDGGGNLYVAGDFYGSADFGSQTLVSGGDRDGFVTKLNSAGTFLWAKRWGTAGGDLGTGVGVDAIGNVYVSGTGGSGTVDILKFNSNGASVWTKSIFGSSMVANDLVVDGPGNVFVGGWFRGCVDFDPGNKTNYACAGSSASDAFVLKLTSKGNFSWVSAFRTQSSSFSFSGIYGVARDGSGNTIVTGFYNGAVDFDPGPGRTLLPGKGGFITKLNSSGGLVWARALESDDGAGGMGLSVDAAGSIYTTGWIRGTTDLDPGAGTASRTSAGGSDVFVMKLDSAGNFAWAEAFGGTGDDYGHGVAVDATGTVHFAGRYVGAVDFDPDPIDEYRLTTPGTFANMFLVRLTQS